ncbi:MAG: hypothetical protein KBB55_02220 [Candidatus Buchananbacteria bacterium]|nr:hypothetical protein [Candidatus Buchananbacteria bacterium]
MNVLTQQRVHLLIGGGIAVAVLVIGVGLFAVQPYLFDQSSDAVRTAADTTPPEPSVSAEDYARERDRITASINQQITDNVLTATAVRSARAQLLLVRVPAAERDHHLQLVTTLDRLAVLLDAGQSTESEVAKWQQL